MIYEYLHYVIQGIHSANIMDIDLLQGTEIMMLTVETVLRCTTEHGGILVVITQI